jgi:hypothetical protein
MAMLIHNQVVRFSSGAWEGMYRIVVEAPRMNKTILVKLTESTSSSEKSRGRKKLSVTKSPRKKAPLPLIGDMIWMDHAQLDDLEREGMVKIIDVEREQFTLSKSDQEQYHGGYVGFLRF